MTSSADSRRSLPLSRQDLLKNEQIAEFFRCARSVKLQDAELWQAGLSTLIAYSSFLKAVIEAAGDEARVQPIASVLFASCNFDASCRFF